MARLSFSDTHFVRIGGVANGSGTPYTFVTRQPPPAWTGAAVVALNNTIKTPSGDLEILGTMIPSPSISAQLRMCSELAPLFARAGGEVKQSGVPVRVTRFVARNATTIHVTDSTPFSTSATYFLGVEAITVTAKPTATTLTVTRAQQGTIARAIPIGDVGPQLYTRVTNAKGLPVTAGVIASDGSEEVRFRGFVDEANQADGKWASVKVRSIVQHLRDAKYTVPTARNAAGPINFRFSDRTDRFIVVDGWPLVEVDTDSFGPSVDDGGPEWTHGRFVGSGGEWVVTALTYLHTVDDDDGRRIDRYNVDLIDTSSASTIPVRAAGVDDEIISFQSGQALGEHLEKVFGDLAAVEWAYVSADSKAFWDDTLWSLMTRAEPYGSGLALPASYLSANQANTQEIGLSFPSIRNTEIGDSGVRWCMPRFDAKKWSDVLRDGWLRPTFTGMGVDEQARLKIFDWLPTDQTSPTEITMADLVGSAPYTWSDKQINARAVYLLDFAYREVNTGRVRGFGTVEEVSTYQTPVVSNTVTSADLANMDSFRVPGVLAGDGDWRALIKGRAALAIKDYGVAVVLTKFEVLPQVALTKGGTVKLTRVDIPTATGEIGTATVLGVVLGLSVSKTRVQSVTIAITGYLNEYFDGGTWAPAATISAWNAGTSYAAIKANDWTESDHPGGIDSDIKPWQILDYAGGEVANVIICDANLATLGTATVTDADDTLGLKLSGATVTPAAGNRVLLASYDAQSSDVKTAAYQAGKGGPVVFLAGSNAKVGAANDAPKGWR